MRGMLPVMLILRWTAIIVGVTIIIVFLSLSHFWWRFSPPTRPQNIPGNSVWITAPVLGGLVLQGGWVGCRLDKQQNIDRCQFSDQSGKVQYEDSYKTCDGEPIAVQESELQLIDHDQSYSFVSLKNGTVLVSTSLCDFRSRN